MYIDDEESQEFPVLDEWQKFPSSLDRARNMAIDFKCDVLCCVECI